MSSSPYPRAPVCNVELYAASWAQAQQNALRSRPLRSVCPNVWVGGSLSGWWRVGVHLVAVVACTCSGALVASVACITCLACSAKWVPPRISQCTPAPHPLQCALFGTFLARFWPRFGPIPTIKHNDEGHFLARFWHVFVATFWQLFGKPVQIGIARQNWNCTPDHTGTPDFVDLAIFELVFPLVRPGVTCE